MKGIYWRSLHVSIYYFQSDQNKRTNALPAKTDTSEFDEFVTEIKCDNVRHESINRNITKRLLWNFLKLNWVTSSDCIEATKNSLSRNGGKRIKVQKNYPPQLNLEKVQLPVHSSQQQANPSQAMVGKSIKILRHVLPTNLRYKNPFQSTLHFLLNNERRDGVRVGLWD